ncbi:hypothetical protein A7U60_g3409 [Sanghuangporus baumii]|uniref:Uncharacterized protein n=1 Tax=Sanghuangporus baumii TaxID=108892 RepID=A0A9Q5N6Y9_SANBA|nr:hypothetical protein A7U60_g3409 [Sanghuangporus baumii]
MRGRSTTVSRTGTATMSTRMCSISFSASLALSLYRHADSPSLQTLPTEILLEIILIATAVNVPKSAPITSSTSRRLGSYADDDISNWHLRGPRLDYRILRALALTSRQLAGLAHFIMYRNIALDELKHISLFARTVLDCAHRDITLASTVSPVSPVSPTSMSFSYIPTLFAGKFTNRLALQYPFFDSPRVPKNRHAEIERFHVATGVLLGFGNSAPSVPSPVLADLRTLLIDTRILEHHLNTHTAPSSTLPKVSPSPSELILHSYIPWGGVTPPYLSPLAPLGVQLTHLTIACPSARWTLPSTTLNVLGGVPSLTHLALVRRAHANEDNDAEFVRDVAEILSERVDSLTTLNVLGGVPSLTHLALVRRAHANEDNDAEFVRDVAEILSERADSLIRLVLVVLPDSGFTTWKYTHQPVLADGCEEEVEEVEHVLSFNPELRALEAYLSTTSIWSQFSTLAQSSPAVCVVPGMSDAWARALRKSRNPGAIFESNIFHDHGRDLWSWARTFESRRRAIERR